MKQWFKSLTIAELSTWIKNYNSLGWNPTNEDIITAKKILKNKRSFFKAILNKNNYISF
jgi:hypothetical protein|tara:strand:- start:43 stop:219 length:177 start_codon:yes stop_codon:yes gene_type:complete